jgi:hypothetical protein
MALVRAIVPREKAEEELPEYLSYLKKRGRDERTGE